MFRKDIAINMKTAFSTLGCPDWTFTKIVECAKNNGINALEIRGINSVMEADKITEFTAENMAETKRILKDNGLKIINFGTSCNFHNDDNVALSIEEGKRTVDVCNPMNIPYIRVFGDTINTQGDTERVIKNVVHGISEICAYGQDKNVTVLLEIHGNFNTAENVSKVMDGLKTYENFGILWDIEHSDKIYGDNWREFYKLIKPIIKHVHIKDYIRASGDAPFKLTTVGDGDIPISDIVNTLIDDGYDGYFSLEWEKKWVPELPEFEVGLESFLRTMGSIVR